MANPYGALVDLDDVAGGTGGYRILGTIPNGSFGGRIAGPVNFNGTGPAELVVSANAGGDGVTQPRVYVQFLDTTGAPTGQMEFRFAADEDFAPDSLAALGDVNGDGRGDLLIGYTFYPPPSAGSALDNSGEAILVLGRANAAAGQVVDLGANSAAGMIRFVTGTADDRVGTAVAGVGDFNDDGRPDFAISAPRRDTNAEDTGTVYVVFGRTSAFPSTVDLTSVGSTVAGIQIIGEASGDRAGRALSGAGDVNSDGVDDLIVGASFNGTAGAAYVVFGSAGATGVRNLSAVAAGTGGFKIVGENTDDFAGGAVSGAGDVNGDGFADLLVGANAHDNAPDDYAGAAYVVYGKSSGSPVQLTDVAAGTGGFMIVGQNADDYAGIGVQGVGDVNGDGPVDLLIGARGNDSGGNLAGAAYLVFGRPGGIRGTIDLDVIAAGTGGFKIQAESAGDRVGPAIAPAGDVNGDGLADLFLGATGVGPNNEGGAYVIYGRTESITAFDDSIRGTTGNDLNIDLLAGNDYYDGREGDDIVSGGPGADYLRGGLGTDVFVIGTPVDYTGPSNSTVRNADMRGTNGAVDATGVAGKIMLLDVLDGGDANDLVIGTAVADMVVLSAPGLPVYAGQDATRRLVSVETFRLQGGNDVLSLTTTSTTKYTTNVTAEGGDGNDVLWTGSGADILRGQNGNDYLVGGFGNDTLTGGANNDLFGFARNFGTDTVADFAQGQDRLRIKGFGASLDGFAELQALPGGITVGAFDAVAGNDTKLTLGSGTTIVLSGFTGTLTASDFQFVT